MSCFRHAGAAFLVSCILSSSLWAEHCGDLLEGHKATGVFIYDITKDSTDYTLWYDDPTLSWCDGPDGLPHFPLRCYLILTDLGLDIIDADTNELRMRFEPATDNALPSTNHNTVQASDGIVWVGSDTGLYEVRFMDDLIRRTDATGVALYNGPIAQRNDAQGYGAVSGTCIVHSVVNDVALIPGFAFVATGEGVSLIDLNSRAVFDDPGDSVAAVEIRNGDLLYHDNDELLRHNGLPTSDFSADHAAYLNGINDIVADGTRIYVGVKGGGVVEVDPATFTVSGQLVKAGFDDTQPFFWNTMHRVSGNSLLSEIGPNLTLSGSSYDIEPAMFAGGWDNNSESTFAYANSNDIVASIQQGAVEWYWVPDDDAGTFVWGKTSRFFSNGATNYPVNDRWYMELFYHTFPEIDAAFHGYIIKRDTSGVSHVCGFEGFPDAPGSMPRIRGNWKAGDRVHLAMAWSNESTILGQYICAFWINGELAYGWTTVTGGTMEGWRTTNPTQPYSTTMRIGDSIFPYSIDEQLRGPVDNITTYAYAKEDWGNRHIEDGSVVSVFAGQAANVRALALQGSNLYLGTNDGSDGGGVSKVDSATNALLYEWTAGNNEVLVDYDTTSLSMWQGLGYWKLLIGTEGGVSVVADQCEPAVPLDIKPGSCPNSFNRSSHGVLPVALLGTEVFDVTMIDVSTVLLSRADGLGGSVAPHEGPPGPHSVFEDVGTPFDGEWCDCHDLGGDGYLDLSMKFKSDDVVDALQLNDLDCGALVELVINANTLDGMPFSARDCVRLVPPGTPPGLLAVLSNAAGAWLDVSPLDNQLDGAGFANFERTFPVGSAVTLTASQTHLGYPFVVWKSDGVMQAPGEASIQVTLCDANSAEALYHYCKWWGDLNADGFRDLTDFTLFASAYGSQLGDAAYSLCADFDGDGFVNITDFSLFVGDYLVPCP